MITLKSSVTLHRISAPLQFIGLCIRPMDASVMKILSPGWYPFGHYKCPELDNRNPVRPMSGTVRTLYKLKRNLPEINVSCIVGMNGSGKSTLLDIIYRLLNNLAFKLMSEKETPIKHELSYAYGVDADFYYVCDGKLNIITCSGAQMGFYRETTGGKMVRIPISDRSFNEILGKFFYTIGINYSIYAFNKNDYTPTVPNEFIDGEWLDGVFHKNDGYLAPITLVPFRENGIIDVKRENQLASKRIMAMSVLARANGKSFPDGYYAETIHYVINKNYKEERIAAFYNSHTGIKSIYLQAVLDTFVAEWEKRINGTEAMLNMQDHEVYETALFYIAYKSFKVCFTYNDYYELFDMDMFINQCTKNEGGFTEYEEKALGPSVIRIVDYILEHPSDHITHKIFQCIDFLEHSNRGLKGDLDVSGFIETYHPKTYDDVDRHLLPAFYECDILFKRIAKRRSKNYWSDEMQKEFFTLSKMSSGEKQILNSISYVIYHLNNIQSVNDDKYRIPYHHVTVVFDEAELYYHPDYQRRFISMFIQGLSWTNIDRRKIRSINLLIATHSPFVLTDVLTEHTIYLQDGKSRKVTQQTFGGNYYEILKSSFFFTESAIGDISSRNIKNWIEEKKTSQKPAEKEIMDLVGDPYINKYLSYIKSEQDV